MKTFRVPLGSFGITLSVRAMQTFERIIIAANFHAIFLPISLIKKNTYTIIEICNSNDEKFLSNFRYKRNFKIASYAK